MKKPLNLFAILVVAVALLALPAAAAAEYLIPDGNSAVNQYTEGIPTGGGNRDTEGSGEDDVEPAETIGAETTRKLDQKGPEGRDLAEVAAETAPPSIAVETDSGRPEGGQPADEKKKSGGNGGNRSDGEEGSAAVAPPSAGGDGPEGSSALAEIISAVTGGSDGGVGLLLPLAIVAALTWGVAFAWRRRDSEHTTSQP